MKDSKDLDTVLKLIDKDESLQILMGRIVRDVQNRNGFMLHELLSQHVDDNATQLLEILEDYIEKNKGIFSNPDTESVSGRINYQHLLFSAKDRDGNVTAKQLSRWLAIHLLSEHLPGIDEYVDSLDNFETAKQCSLDVDDTGLVDLANPRIVIRDHALQVDKDTRLYLHQFMRRHFGANFVGIPPLLRMALEKNYEVRGRLDPLRISSMKGYTEIVELDYWHGAHFDLSILNSKDKKELWTVHGSDDTKGEVKALGMSYPVSQTHFRTSMMDDNLRQFSIEEYVPRMAGYGAKSPNFGKKYHIQKYAHFVYDQARGTIEHLDCAIRVFGVDEYLNVFREVQRGKDPGRQLGNRYKLFKIRGALDLEFVQTVLYEFFRYNPHLMEYFGNKTFDEVWEFLQA